MHAQSLWADLREVPKKDSLKISFGKGLCLCELERGSSVVVVARFVVLAEEEPRTLPAQRLASTSRKWSLFTVTPTTSASFLARCHAAVLNLVEAYTMLDDAVLARAQ